MKKSCLGIAAALGAMAVSGIAHAASLFMGAYPDSVVVFDDKKGALIDRIKLETGLPTSLRLSQDKKFIYVTTLTNGGVEVIDVATRKVVKNLTLNTPTARYRFSGGVPDPSGKLFYTVATKIDKNLDRYDVEEPKFTIIDLDKKEVIKTVALAEEDENALRGGFARIGVELSPDGKFLYHFGDKVVVIDTEDFKVVDRIQLARPDLDGLETGTFGNALETIREPGHFTSVFNAADPIVRNKVFGVGRFDLAKRTFDFTPVGPAPANMTGLQVAPNKRDAFAVVTTGLYGNKRCEFWRIDLTTNVLRNKSEFSCKSRFSFGMSHDGRKLYIFGASFDLEVYNTETLRLESTWDLNNDVTGAGMVVVE